MASTGGSVTSHRFGPWRHEARAFLELAALTGVAFVQPTLDVLSKNASVFVTRDTTPFEAILFVLAVVAVPPVVAWVAEVLVGLIAPRARPVVHVLLLAALVGVIAVEVVARNTSLAHTAIVALAALVAIAGGVAIARYGAVRLWLRYLAIATPVFVLLFLGFSPVTDAVFTGGPTSAADVQVKNDVRVVMVVMDELPETSLLDGHGRVDSTLFPNFAALAGGSTWYRNTTTVAPYTQIAVPAILTGQYPHAAYPVSNAVAFPHSIFTLLGGAYEMNVHESATRICPESFCGATGGTRVGTEAGVRGLLSDGWTSWHDFAWPDRHKASVSFTSGTVSLSSNHALSTGERFVRSLRPGRAARLDFLHVVLPHQPWHYLPTGQDYEGTAARGAPEYSWETDAVARSARTRHLLQLQAADRLLGRIVARLKHLGVYDRSLVVVTADHGVSFIKGNAVRGVSEGNYQDVAWTPLFIKAPRQASGRVDDRPVESIDILPTIADLLHVRIPWKVDGRSALGPRRRERTRPIYKWELNQVKPPRGRDFVPLDGPEGFRRAMRGRASSAGGDPDLRLYRAGPYGPLIGRNVSSFPVVEGGPSGRIDDLDRYAHVDLHAHRVPWAYMFGTLDAANGVPVAVAANGRLVGFAETYSTHPGHHTPWWTVLPPELLHDGRNDIQVYVVQGSAAHPTFRHVRVD
ncbi:MAG: sulfatase-like hydrolase/transferase [Acidimicrobiia bacterium]|nr:sulfatase-like hydrolase/transferase [Acidimicrobiia bacterium]